MLHCEKGVWKRRKAWRLLDLFAITGFSPRRLHFGAPVLSALGFTPSPPRHRCFRLPSFAQQYTIAGFVHARREPGPYRPRPFRRHVSYRRGGGLKSWQPFLRAFSRYIAMDASVDGSIQPLLGKLRLPFTQVAAKTSSFLGNAKMHAAAACVQILYAGFQVLASAALSNGASTTIFPVYRNAIAAIFVGTIALFAERKTRPPLSVMKTFQLLLCGFIGVCVNQLLFLLGLHYTSATFASTVQNLTPALTFVVALLFGIERLQIGKLEDKAKVLGVLVGMGGATVIALYKGPPIINSDGLSVLVFGPEYVESFESSSYVSLKLGLLCLLGNCTTWAIWFILQAPVSRDYPAYLSAATLTYMFGSIQLAIIAVCVERDIDIWASTFYTELPALLYGGLVASGVAMTLQGWCAYRGGPVLVAAYQPLQTILVAILSTLFLHETFYVGSLIGGFFVIAGLYLVVWGKSRERRYTGLSERKQIVPLPHSSDNSGEIEGGLIEPLLS